ncbi:MAG: hypothetical protein ACXWU7_16750, partial [Telluria sp.]
SFSLEDAEIQHQFMRVARGIIFPRILPISKKIKDLCDYGQRIMIPVVVGSSPISHPIVLHAQ